MKKMPSETKDQDEQDDEEMDDDDELELPKDEKELLILSLF